MIEDFLPTRNARSGRTAMIFLVTILLSLGLFAFSRHLPSEDPQFHMNATGTIALCGVLAGVMGLAGTALRWLVNTVWQLILGRN